MRVALICAIHGATIENILFEDTDGANTFRIFLSNLSIFTFEKKLLLTRCTARANILVIILLHDSYFLKYCF